MVLAADLSEYEQETIAYHKNTGELTDGEWQGIPVLDFKPEDKSDYYYQAKHNKNKILLHYTMGYLGGDLTTLTRNNFHVSVPFVVARSGEIVRLFDPDYWSNHLGPGAKGGNGPMSRSSVAIELSNLGPLEKSGDWIWNSYGSRFCRLDEHEHYIDLGQEYRSYRYYARFTPEQYQVTHNLVKKIAEIYTIPNVALDAAERYKLFATSAKAVEFKGICSHVNFRPPGEKTDIGPAFDWGALGIDDDGAVVW